MFIDYQLTVEGKRGPPKYVPGNIADYEPGHSSISEREKQIVSFLFCGDEKMKHRKKLFVA